MVDIDRHSQKIVQSYQEIDSRTESDKRMKQVVRTIVMGKMIHQTVDGVEVIKPVKLPDFMWETVSVEHKKIVQTAEITDSQAKYYIDWQKKYGVKEYSSPFNDD